MIPIFYCGNDRIFEGVFLSAVSVARRTEEALEIRILTMDDSAANPKYLPITKEHVDGLKALINGSQKPPATQNKIFEIISEEADMYYSGAKSLDETVKIIQNRVSTYISEIS